MFRLSGRVTLLLAVITILMATSLLSACGGSSGSSSVAINRIRATLTAAVAASQLAQPPLQSTPASSDSTVSSVDINSTIAAAVQASQTAQPNMQNTPTLDDSLNATATPAFLGNNIDLLAQSLTDMPSGCQVLPTEDVNNLCGATGNPFMLDDNEEVTCYIERAFEPALHNGLKRHVQFVSFTVFLANDSYTNIGHTFGQVSVSTYVLDSEESANVGAFILADYVGQNNISTRIDMFQRENAIIFVGRDTDKADGECFESVREIVLGYYGEPIFIYTSGPALMFPPTLTAFAQ